MNILDEIYAHKASVYPQNRPSLVNSLLQKKGSPIIGEIKRGSPSMGLFAEDLDISNTVERYRRHDVCGISVLTDEKYFYGGFEDLERVSQLTEKPLLCKDFIVSHQQIAKAFSHGASVILLIARMLDKATLSSLIAFAHQLSLEVLMEIHLAEEYEKIKTLPFDILGINNRDLDTFQTDINHSIAVYNELNLKEVSFPVISESGFMSIEAIEHVISKGFSGVLVGEGMVKGKIIKRENIDGTSKEQSIKICGLKDTSAIDVAYKSGATHVGFVLAESKRKITQEQAQILIAYTQTNCHPMKSVVVLKDVRASYVNTLSKTLNPDYFQVHGDLINDEPIHRTINLIVATRMKAIRALVDHDLVLTASSDKEMPILIDSSVPGSGERFDWTIIPALKAAIDRPLWIAGGLTPENVKSLIKTYGVAGVDVSSGVEKYGEKNHDMIRLFIKEAKEGFQND
jgi:indole-3-glycerol phosphate synthase/phosphoribosylanthranilate isomerase